MVSQTELAKWVLYRTPILANLFAPRYPYKIDPGQLTFLCNAITETAGSGGAILEIGVAKGDTSAFLLEHLKTTRDPRRIYFLDTFAGFTRESVSHEVEKRGKPPAPYDAFRYGDEDIFIRNLKRLGYKNFETVRGDASRLDYAQFGPIDVVLLDIDLYQPTKIILEKLWDQMATPGFICIDDCLDGTPWDGSLQAYLEFSRSHDLSPAFVGAKGGILVKRRKP